MKNLSGLLLAFFSAIGAVAAQVPSPSPTALPKPLNAEFKKILETDSEAVKIIAANHISGSRLNPEQLTTVSLHYLLQSLDPHSDYLNAEQAEEFRTAMNPQYFGIGSGLTEIRNPGGEVLGVFIRETFRGGPSERAGLRFGDAIVEIDGLPMRGKDFIEVRSHLIGARGTKVIVTIERNGARLRNDIIRDAIPTPSIPDAYLIRPDVGYIALTENLTRNTHDELVAALSKLRAAGMKSLILDIRNNVGGFARQACLAVSEFVSYGQRIFSTEGRASDGSANCVSENKKADVETPIVAMISPKTASSAEFLSAGLQDTDRAFFVGENTFGKGLLQSGFELEGGRRLYLTTSRFVAATGRRPQRDYSDGSLYRYYSDAGSVEENSTALIAKRPAFKTRTGRTLLGGGGITPDEIVHPLVVNERLSRWRNSLDSIVFSFTRELVAGRLPGLESYRLDGPAVRDHELKDDELPVTNGVFQAFRAFAVEGQKVSAARFDANRTFLERSLRTELIVAAYGSTIAKRINDRADPQLLRAIDAVPNAKLLLTRALTTPNVRK